MRRGITPNHSEAIPEEEAARITKDLIAALKTVYDPEIPVDIYELGLIYKVDLDDDRNVEDRHDADGARLPGGRRDAGLGGERRALSVEGIRTSRSTWSSIRRGTRRG